MKWGARRTRRANPTPISSIVGFVSLALYAAVLTLACKDSTPPIIVEAARPTGTENPLGPYVLTATVSDNALLSVFVRYSVALGADVTLAMERVSDGNYQAALGGFPRGSRVDYYIFATDREGNQVREPSGAPLERYCFDIGGYPSTPKLLDLYPVKGPATGGTRVRLVGLDLRPASRILFGTAEATGLAFDEDGQIVVTTPPGVEGVIDVTIVNPSRKAAGTVACPIANPDEREGRHTLVGAFTYTPPPKPVAIAPDNGPTLGGTLVTVTGTGFAAGATLKLGENFATGTVVAADGKTITGRTIAHATGYVDVCVKNPDQGEGCLRAGFEYVPPPDIVSIAPTSGPDSGGTTVVITGTSFRPEAKVYFGATVSPSVVWETSIRMTAVTPAHAAGFTDVKVENRDLQSDTLANGFYFVGPPVVTSVTPARGPTLGGQTVTIVGQSFATGLSVSFGGVAATVVSVSADFTTIVVTTPASALEGFVGVTVTNPAPDGRSGTKASAYEYYAPPTIASLLPTSGPTAGGTVVTITGSRFTGVSQVTFDATPGINLTFVNATTVLVTTPAHAKGLVNVTMTIATGGTGTCANCYTFVAPPSISGVSPSSGPLEGCIEITVNGADFQSGATVTIGGLACAPVTFVSATQLKCRPAAGTSGAKSMVVTNPDGQSFTLAAAYTYTPLTFSPGGGLSAGFTRLRVFGAGFVNGAQVSVGGAAHVTTFVTSMELSVANTLAGAIGSAAVTVLSNGCTNTAAALYEYRHFKEKQTFATGYATEHVRFADLRRNGRLDMVVANARLQAGGAAQPGQVWQNDGAGNFTLRQTLDTGNWYHVDIFDADGVNGPDVLIAGDGTTGSSYYQNDGTGTLTRPTAHPLNQQNYGAFDAQFIDTDGDGDRDIVLLQVGQSSTLPYQSQPDYIFRNDGNGQWTRIELPSNGNVHDHRIAWADFRHTGRLDIAANVQNSGGLGGNNVIWMNNGANSFATYRSAPFGTMFGDMFGLAAADADGDGWADLFVPNIQCGAASKSLLKNSRISTMPEFASVASAFGSNIEADGFQDAVTGVEVVDIDGDGDMDVLWIVTGYCPSQSVSWTNVARAQRFFVNDGSGNFFSAAASMPKTGGGLDVMYQALGAGFGDVDGNGSVDMAIGSDDSGNHLYIQTIAP